MKIQILQFVVFLILGLVSGLPKYEKVTLEIPQQHQSQPHYESQRSILPLDVRLLEDWTLSDLLLVSDIDGNLHGVERNTGAFLWSLPIDEPLVQILTTSVGQAGESQLLWFVEPFEEGSLYYFSPNYGLNKLPASIKTLVLESPFLLGGDNKIYTGTRSTSLYLINIHTGQVISQYGHDDEACPVLPNVHIASPIESDEHVILGKTTYKLTIHSTVDDNLIWNVTYSQWGPNNIDNDLIMQNAQSKDNMYFTPFHDKSLLAIDRKIGTPAWVVKLPSLAVNVFDIFLSSQRPEHVMLPHPMKVLNNLQNGGFPPTNDLCLINKTANGREWFAMSFLNYPSLLKLAPVSKYQLGLYQLENGVTDDVHAMKNLVLDDSQAEQFISGVHRINHLGPENFYQPVAKFTTALGIEDKNRDNVPASTEERLKQVPTVMDGILFPQPRDSPQKMGLITYDNPYTEVPRPVESLMTEMSKRISVTRRIAEDLLVMVTLLFCLMAFGKVHLVLRGSSENDKKVLLENSSFEDNAPVPSEPQPVEKKVRVITPDDSDRETVEDDEQDADQEQVSKKKRKRGSRGGKRAGRRKAKDDNADSKDLDDTDATPEVEEWTASDMGALLLQGSHEPAFTTKSLVSELPPRNWQTKKILTIDKNLVITDKILGYGSHGTVVYEGTFESRPVAVKRMLLDFYDIASHEVRLLQESDDHPNVIRYFCSQLSESEKFLYIALELCACTLEDVVEKQKLILPKHSIQSNVLHQLASGLHYLHSLKIVHRDLKPQNILLGDSNKLSKSSVRLLISDFGLCKKLDADQSSFRATTQNAASGTSGWRAPELLLHHDLLEISPDTIASNNSTTNSLGENVEPGNKRLTKAIDIFSLGCVFYYVLSGGGHPFGDRYLREGNIIRGEYDISALRKFCPLDHVEASDMISNMLLHDPSMRPSTNELLKHPYFWGMNKKLEFLLKVSDRFEIERRDPPSELLLSLESVALNVHGGDWLAKCDPIFVDNLGKYRKYHTGKCMDLLRALRNKYHHFNDMPPELQTQMSPLPHGFYRYFNDRFPHLLMEVYSVVRQNLAHEHAFHEYF